MKLMHVDASPKGAISNSRALAALFVHALQQRIPELEIDYLDVSIDPPPHVTQAFAVATYKPEAERTPEMKAALALSDAMCARLLRADALLFSMPMYNFSMPSSFKAFIDNIVRGGLTYIVTPNGQYVGQLADKKVLFVTSRGADLRPGTPMESMDALTPALRAAFGFLGVANPKFVDAQPMQFADTAAREAALARAKDEIMAVARDWASGALIA